MSERRQPLAILPRLMRIREAAIYVGVGQSKFREMVSAGRIAQPTEEDGVVRWRTEDLDEYVDGLLRRGETRSSKRPTRAL